MKPETLNIEKNDTLPCTGLDDLELDGAGRSRRSKLSQTFYKCKWRDYFKT